MIGAIVVLYKPDIEQVSIFLTSLFSQVSKIIIVDNSPNSNKSELLGVYTQYIHLSNNQGIASAHNKGLMALMSLKASHAVIFDQDSFIEPDLVDSLYSEMKKIQSSGIPIAAIGPQVICKYSNKAILPKVQKHTAVYENTSIVPQIIASGMLIDLSVIKDVGFKESDLFIDGVDHEWCWRARKKGYVVGINKHIHMVHTLGDKRSNFLGLSYKVGAPIRLYYQFRNLLILSRRSYVPLYWKFRHLAYMPLKFVLMSVFEENRVLRVNYMIKGIIDGLRGVKGKLIIK